MGSQALFTSSEWKTLQFAPLWVFGAVANADGKIDKKEVDALVLQLSQPAVFKEILVRDVIDTLGKDFGNLFNQFGADSRNVVQGLTDVADILDRKVSPQTAYNFKASMLIIGYNVSESTGKGFLGMGQKALDQKHKALDAVAMIMRFSMTPPAATASPAAKPASKPVSAPAAPVISKRTSFYLLVDSSRYISDMAYLLDDGLRRLPDKMRIRPQRGIGVDMSLILADNTGRVVTPLTDSARFAAPSLLGRGRCGMGQALRNLLSDISSHKVDGKPLVVIVLAGAPEDDWENAADQLRALAQNGQANVFILAIGGYSDAAVLKRLTVNSPLVLSDVTQANMHQSFDWLYTIIDIILTGMESGAAGQRRNIPAPPACLVTIP